MSNTTDNLRKGDWTAKEIQMLIDYYPTMRTTKLAAMLHRAPHCVKTRANKMGIRKANGVTFRKESTSTAKPQQETSSSRLCHRCVNYPCFRGIDNLETDFARVGCRGYKEREPQQLNPS